MKANTWIYFVVLCCVVLCCVVLCGCVRAGSLHCRANEFDPRALFQRYIGFIQDIYFLPRVPLAYQHLQEEHSTLRVVRGFLRKSVGE